MTTPPLSSTAVAKAPGAAPIAPFDAAHPAWAALSDTMQSLGGQLLATPQGPEFVASDNATRAAGGPIAAVCPLPDYGLLSVTGADAGPFLQSQLTNDLLAMEQTEARWTGYCTPKGRLITTALNWTLPQGFALAVARTQAETLRKRLSMYVLRAKAKVVDASPGWIAFGLIGDAIAPVLAALQVPVPTAAMTVARGPGDAAATAIALAPISLDDERGDLARVMLWLPIADDQGQALTTPLATLQAVAGPMQASALWRWTEVRAAVPRLFTSSAELFVPQMVNLESVGGVNFKKGCYPGQEIVARSQYLGKLKRRMFAGHLDIDARQQPLPAPGQDVVPAAGGEPSGQVVLSAPSPFGGIDVLFESQIGAVEDGGVQIDGVAVQRQALPYALNR